jgi:hypothetical protein
MSVSGLARAIKAVNKYHYHKISILRYYAWFQNRPKYYHIAKNSPISFYSDLK